MRTFQCICGNRLYFDNTRCLRCERRTGWCPCCNTLRGLDPAGDGLWRCTAEGCGALLKPCANYAVANVCNRMVRADCADTYCEVCRHNRTVPDTSIPGNREKWARLESAKRRLFYTLDLIGLPYGTERDGFDPPLRFDFKAEMIRNRSAWHSLGPVDHVYTGHARGRITINLDEADDAERERRRINMNEAHRTLVGHFRHEIGHYYWELLVAPRHLDAFRAEFGDHEQPTYGEALKRHYADGPPADWQEHYISAYASMHPWEDFAETFAAYLDMIAVMDTAAHWGLTDVIPPAADLDTMMGAYADLGLRLNEINREMGLLDVVPEVLIPPVRRKLRFVDTLIRAARAEGRTVHPTGEGEARA